MLNILSILNYMHNGIVNRDPRFVIEDPEHILDTATGVRLHAYNNWFKITHNNKVVATIDDFTLGEQEIFRKIKQCITPSEEMREDAEHYKAMQHERRVHLAELFENPMPTGVVLEESNTTEYTG